MRAYLLLAGLVALSILSRVSADEVTPYVRLYHNLDIAKHTDTDWCAKAKTLKADLLQFGYQVTAARYNIEHAYLYSSEIWQDARAVHDKLAASYDDRLDDVIATKRACTEQSLLPPPYAPRFVLLSPPLRAARLAEHEDF